MTHEEKMREALASARRVIDNLVSLDVDDKLKYLLEKIDAALALPSQAAGEVKPEHGMEIVPIPISDVEDEAERLRHMLDTGTGAVDPLYAAYNALLMVLGYGVKPPSEMWKEDYNPPPSPSGAVGEGQLVQLKDRIDSRLNDYLCEMKPDYDDSIVGFNEAWDIVRKVFADAIAQAPPPTREIDTTKLNGGQLVQRIMRAMDGTSPPSSTAKLAEEIAASIMALPADYWRRGVAEDAPALFDAVGEGWQLRASIKICREVGELPDRTSPDENADMMLVTPDELLAIITDALAAAPQPPRVTEEEKHNLNPEQLRTLQTLDVDAALKAIADKGFTPGTHEDVLAALHKIRLQCDRYFTKAQIAASKSWLCKHGYSHDL